MKFSRVWILAILASFLLVGCAYSHEDEDQEVRSRIARASPLRWGKRAAPGHNDILRWGKREAPYDYDLGEADHSRVVREAPLRWGKRASPLRWGKRNVDDQIQELMDKRAPLRWGKRLSELLEEPWYKRSPVRFGKRAPSRFGKRGPSRFGKREDDFDMDQDQLVED